MNPKPFRSTPHRGTSIAVLAALLALFVVLALSASIVGRVGIDSPESPVRAPVGLGL
jgi:hypothetical protein